MAPQNPKTIPAMMSMMMKTTFNMVIVINDLVKLTSLKSATWIRAPLTFKKSHPKCYPKLLWQIIKRMMAEVSIQVASKSHKNSSRTCLKKEVQLFGTRFSSRKNNNNTVSWMGNVRRVLIRLNWWRINRHMS